MERREPSFTPEWLRAGNGNSSSLTSYQSELQSYLGTASELDYPRNPSTSDQVYQPASWRHLNSNSLKNYITVDKESVSQSQQGIYSRQTTLHLADSQLEVEPDGCKEGDGECSHDMVGDRNSSFESRVDERDRDYNKQLPSEEFWRQSKLSSGKYDLASPLKRQLSSGRPSKLLQNGGTQRYAVEIGNRYGFIGSSGDFSRSIQKAIFDRDFPSLGALDKSTVLHSSLGDVSSLTGRMLGQASQPKLEGGGGGRIASLKLSNGGSFGRVRAISEAVSNSDNVPVGNAGGVVTASNAKSLASIITTSAAATGNGSSVSGQSAPKMADALLQNPPPVRTTSQLSVETQRVEELNMKQFRQLIPIKPSFPKTLGHGGLSPRDKSKSKIGRTLDTMLSATKTSQVKVQSQSVSPLYRSSAPIRFEPSGKPQSGMLVVQRSGKEVAVAVSPSSTLKFDANSPFSDSVFTSYGPLGVVPSITTTTTTTSTTTITTTTTNTTTASVLATSSGVVTQKQQKPMMDRRLSEGGSVASKESSLTTVSEDKRPSLQAQNRSDFFNALRRKAALGSAVNSDSMEALGVNTLNNMKSGSASSTAIAGPGFERLIGGISDLQSNAADLQGKGIDSASLACSKSSTAGNDISANMERNDAKSDDRGGSYARTTNGMVASRNGTSRVHRVSEEEEAAFLKSLGWVEDSGEEEEALTQEEINSFLSEHMTAVISRFLRHNSGPRLRNLAAALQTEKEKCTILAASLADMESEEPCVQRC